MAEISTMNDIVRQAGNRWLFR